MEYNFAKQLVEQEIMLVDTQFTAMHSVISSDSCKSMVTRGYFLLKSYEVIDDKIFFYTEEKKTEKEKVLTPEDILEIDGMTPKRFCAAFYIR